jgi:hypothetical protein
MMNVFIVGEILEETTGRGFAHGVSQGLIGARRRRAAGSSSRIIPRCETVRKGVRGPEADEENSTKNIDSRDRRQHQTTIDLPAPCS